MKITELRPYDVFYWFNEICHIPHGSGNTAELADFCVSFAEKRGLEYHRDSTGNVIIYKPASAGRSDDEPIILQGHMDMVCDKTSDCPKDMTAEGVDPMTDGVRIWADKTTLGADDGIALAYIMAILDRDDISHPPIEAVLTVDEEVGLIGASALDCSILKSRRGINIDSEEEGIITVSCAGGVRANCEIPIEFTEPDMAETEFIRLSVSGLLGGHSGCDIDKHRQNGIILLGRLLDALSREADFNICDVSGGTAMNVIPKSAEAVIACKKCDSERIISKAALFADRMRREYVRTEPSISAAAERCEHFGRCADSTSTRKIIFALLQTPNGITAMDPDISGMVQSSLNMGTAAIVNDRLILSGCVRSNDPYGKKIIVDRLISFYSYLGGCVSLDSDYPAWEYKADSLLRDQAVSTFKRVYGREPHILSIHAGLECGILSSKLDNGDLISFGPDIENAHTPNETIDVSSARRCYEYLIALLEEI